MAHPIINISSQEIPREIFELIDPDSGDPIDLTGVAASTIFIYIRKKGEATNKFTGSNQEATSVVTPETSGKITYDFPTALETGQWQAEIEIPVGPTQSRFSQRIDIEVIDGLKLA